jgi:hypothetical protein
MADSDDLATLRAEVAELREAVQFLLKQEIGRMPRINLWDGDYVAPRMVWDALGIPYDDDPQRAGLMVINRDVVREQERQDLGDEWDDDEWDRR